VVTANAKMPVRRREVPILEAYPMFFAVPPPRRARPSCTDVAPAPRMPAGRAGARYDLRP
jgi:hypothetical protein